MAFILINEFGKKRPVQEARNGSYTGGIVAAAIIIISSSYIYHLIIIHHIL
jgi:hypothetical protein